MPQKAERSILDIAGRFHDFQAGTKIQRPDLAEEFTPVIGPAWDAVADLQEGKYGSAAFNGFVAAADLFQIGYGVKAIRTASKITRELGTIIPTAAAVQRKFHKLGYALPGQEVHHVFHLKGIPRDIPNWRNLPFLLKPADKVVHRRIHGNLGGMPAYDPILRYWHGTTDWMKAGAVDLAARAADTAQNLENFIFETKKPIPRPLGRPAETSRNMYGRRPL